MYAVVSVTPARLIAERANADQPNMGLQNWSGDRLLQADAMVGKNYLAEAEVAELNRVTSILLDVFEDQLAIGRLTKMDECVSLLDDQLRGLGRAVLGNPGPPSSDDAKAHAKEQYRLFDQRRRAALKAQADADLLALKAAGKVLPKAAAKPPFPDTAFYLGMAYLKNGDDANAEKWLKQATQLDPKDSRAFYQLATLYRKQGRTEDANAAFARTKEEKVASEKLTQLTWSRWPSSTVASLPVQRSQMWTLWSSPARARSRESGENVTVMG